MAVDGGITLHDSEMGYYINMRGVDPLFVDRVPADKTSAYSPIAAIEFLSVCSVSSVAAN